MLKAQIAVIGSNNLDENQEEYKIAQDLGERLIDEDFLIICGGIGGVMEAVCRGAKLSLNYKEGMTVGILPSLDPKLANQYVDIRIATGFSLARNQIIIASADVVIAVSGGAGTLSEIAFAWQLNKPIIALSATGGWSAELAGKKVVEDERYDKILDADDVEKAISYVLDIVNKQKNV